MQWDAPRRKLCIARIPLTQGTIQIPAVRTGGGAGSIDGNWKRTSRSVSLLQPPAAPVHRPNMAATLPRSSCARAGSRLDKGSSQQAGSGRCAGSIEYAWSRAAHQVSTYTSM